MIDRQNPDSPTSSANPAGGQSFLNGKQSFPKHEQSAWRDFTWIDGVRYRITERQRVDQWVPKPGQEGKRNPDMLHVAFMACRVEVA